VRVAAVDLVLVERDESLVEIAQANLAANKLSGRVVGLDVTANAAAFARAGLPPDSAERILMNPPFNDPARHRASPVSARRGAHEEDRDTLPAWLRAARRMLRPAGTVSLIWRADGIGRVLGALEDGFGAVTVLPVYPRPDVAAIRILVRATKGSKAVPVLLPGVYLNERSGEASDEVQAVLRGAAVLPLSAL
jgi:tRNA1(Val) A37 N6-methylase TrmN6